MIYNNYFPVWQVLKVVFFVFTIRFLLKIVNSINLYYIIYLLLFINKKIITSLSFLYFLNNFNRFFIFSIQNFRIMNNMVRLQIQSGHNLHNISCIVLSLSSKEKSSISQVRVYFLVRNRTLNEFRMTQINRWTL